jgi:hypothetical protein
MDPCRIESGYSVETDSGKEWSGTLTREQCERFRPGALVGRGSFAAAYELAEDPSKVVKFTADPDDAKAARVLMGSKPEGSVRVFSVAQLRGHEVNAPYRLEGESDIGDERKSGMPLYAIVTERVNDKYDRRFKPPIWALQEIVQENRDKWMGKKPSAKFKLPAKAQKVIAEQCSREDEESDCLERGAQVMAAYEDTARAGVVVTDIHDGNWGQRGSKPVILDFGVSAHEDLPIDLARAPRALRRKRRK